MLEKIHDILHFWFGDSEQYELVAFNWWKKDDDFDSQIRDNFEETLVCATNGKLKPWLSQPLGCLAYIVLTDQFPRNIYRNTPQAFSYDNLAKEACLHALEHELDKDLNVVQRQFMYMPLMHSESLDDQKQCVGLFKKLLLISEDESPEYLPMMSTGHDFAVRHYEIIERFGRFPHRNQILGRESSGEELAFLKEPNSGF